MNPCDNSGSDSDNVGSAPVPAPPSLATFCDAVDRRRAGAFAAVADNDRFFSGVATARTRDMASAKQQEEEDEETFLTGAQFHSAPVFRSAGAAPAMLAPSDIAAAGAVFDPTDAVLHASFKAMPRAADFSKAAVPLPPVSAPAYAFAAVELEAPPMPHPYILSHQSWTVRGGSMEGATTSDVFFALRSTFDALGMDAELRTATCEFRVAAVVDHRCVRFAVRLFSEGKANTVVEFQLTSGGSMEYHQAYAQVVAALPRDVAAGCSARDCASSRAATRASLCSPPPLDGCAEVAHIVAGDAAPLVSMLKSGCISMQRDAAAALVELSTENVNAAALVADGVLTEMAALVATSSDWTLVHAGATTIANILNVVFPGDAKSAPSAVEAAVAASRRALDTLLTEVRRRSRSSLSSDTASQQALRRECCRALASMALNAQVAAMMEQAGGVDALHAAQRGTDKREAEFASRAMQRLLVCVA